jgi:hypothetical protein
MASRHDQSFSVSTLPIPESGLEIVLSSWTGRGSLFEALSATKDDIDPRQWSSSDVRNRANRILLARLEPIISRWPKRTSQWINYLPASKDNSYVVLAAPFGGVNWAETRRRFGWPPRAFQGKLSERSTDLLVLQIFRWCLDRLNSIWISVGQLNPDFNFNSRNQIIAALALLNEKPLLNAVPSSPTRTDLIALRREGSPWGSVAEVTHQLLDAEKSLQHLAYDLLMPDEDMRWRIFHLAVFGLVLQALKRNHSSVTSIRPLSPKSEGPNYNVKTSNGRILYLWFEASSVWSHFGKKSPFNEATKGMKKINRSNGADILLLEPERGALIIECKYSSNREWIARNGYYQALAYAAEVRTLLAPHVMSFVIGPETMIPTVSVTNVIAGTIGTAPPSAINEIVNTFLVNN